MSGTTIDPNVDRVDMLLGVAADMGYDDRVVAGTNIYALLSFRHQMLETYDEDPAARDICRSGFMKEIGNVLTNFGAGHLNRKSKYGQEEPRKGKFKLLSAVFGDRAAKGGDNAAKLQREDREAWMKLNEDAADYLDELQRTHRQFAEAHESVQAGHENAQDKLERLRRQEGVGVAVTAPNSTLTT